MTATNTRDTKLPTWVVTDWSPVSCIKMNEAVYYRNLLARHMGASYAWIKARLDRAVKICTTPGACKPGDDPATFLVKSQHNPRGSYIVTYMKDAPYCTCPDWPKAKSLGGRCKHFLAIGIHIHGPQLQYQLQMERIKIKSK